MSSDELEGSKDSFAFEGGALEADDAALSRRILSGQSRELQMLAARGGVPMSLPGLMAVQVALVFSDDLEVATASKKSLDELAPGIVSETLEECDDQQVLSFFAAASSHELILRALIPNRAIRPAVLEDLAPTLSAELQEVLLLRQDLIVDNESLLDRLESNPNLSSYSQRKIAEYREHLVARVAAPLVEPLDEEGIDPAAASLEETAEAIEVARKQPRDGSVEDITGLTETQIKTLPTPVRLRLTYGASRTLKLMLIRDPSTVVALSALKNNSWSELEIERVAGNRLISAEILENLGRDRKWIRKPAILRALAKNPRMPVAMALRFIPKLSVQDLRQITREHGCAAVVKSTATRLYRMRRT